MMFLRRLFGLDFPDPAAGQVWRSRHSGAAFRVGRTRLSDCGKLWHITLHYMDERGEFIPIGASFCMFPSQWRRMLRDEGRVLGTGAIEPSKPWPRDVTEPSWWAGALNRRTTVEQWMFDAARGKRPMPTPDELRAWAIKLGTPEAGEPSGVQVCPKGKGECAEVLPDVRCFGCPDGVNPVEAPSWWWCEHCQCEAPTENVNLRPTHKTCGHEVAPADGVPAAHQISGSKNSSTSPDGVPAAFAFCDDCTTRPVCQRQGKCIDGVTPAQETIEQCLARERREFYKARPAAGVGVAPDQTFRPSDADGGRHG